MLFVSLNSDKCLFIFASTNATQMRGSQNFSLLFENEAPEAELKAVSRIGRDAELIESRNELLLHRYYWHGTRELEPGLRMSFESVITAL